MKTQILLFLIVLGIAPMVFAANYNTKTFNFEFKFAGESFPVSISKASYNEALEDAAVECFNHFTHSKGNDKVKIAEDKALDIIDECANPKKSSVEYL